MTVQDVMDVLFQLAPAELKEEWDNVGLLCGRSTAQVHKAIIALDATLCVLQEAAETGCDLLITHHPILFGEIREVSSNTPTGAALLYAAEHGIACVNLHTNLDCVFGGVNDVLAQWLSLRDYQLLQPRGRDAAGREYGYVRHGFIPSCSLPRFLSTVKEQLVCGSLRYADGGKEVHHVAVGGGACADQLYAVAAAGCDTYVTADVKYHQFLDAAALGLTLIDAGHFQTENPVCEVMYRHLKQSLPSLDICLSARHADVICFD